jgi:hypothetical protein
MPPGWRSGESPRSRPKYDGAARLLGELLRIGLAPDAVERAAALIICLDEAAAIEREAMAS